MGGILSYFHLATIGEYQTIYNELVGKMIESNLIDKVDTLYICIVGDGDLKKID